MDSIVEGNNLNVSEDSGMPVGERFRQWVDQVDSKAYLGGTKYAVDPDKLSIVRGRFCDVTIGYAYRGFYHLDDDSGRFEPMQTIGLMQTEPKKLFHLSNLSYPLEGGARDITSRARSGGLMRVEFSESRMHDEPKSDAKNSISVSVNQSGFNINLQWAVKNGACSFSITPNFDPSFLGWRTNKAITYPFGQATAEGESGGSYQIEPVPQDQEQVRLVYKDDSGRTLYDLLIPIKIDIQKTQDTFSEGIDLRDPLNPKTNLDSWRHLDPLQTVGIKYNP